MQFKRENVIIQCMLKMWDEFLRLFFSISETTRYTQPFCGHQKICRGDSNNRQVRYSNGQLFVFHQIMDSHLYTWHWDTGLGFAHFSDGFCYLKVCYLDPTVSSVSLNWQKRSFRSLYKERQRVEALIKKKYCWLKRV